MVEDTTKTWQNTFKKKEGKMPAWPTHHNISIFQGYLVKSARAMGNQPCQASSVSAWAGSLTTADCSIQCCTCCMIAVKHRLP